MKSRFLLIIIFMVLVYHLKSQTVNNLCGFDKYYQSLISTNPNGVNELNNIGSGLSAFKTSNAGSLDNTIYIPIVFHVVYDPFAPEQNISDDQIFSQLAILNSCYSNGNSNALGIDTKIQFCLAKRDPSNQVTTGITRHSGALNQYNIETYTYGNDMSQLTSSAYWDATKYLNVWIANLKTQSSPTGPLIDLGGRSNIVGFPNITNVDGILLHYKHTGSIGEANIAGANLGKTLVHETGHWLGLYHTFQGAQDINDPLKNTTCSNAACAIDGDKICATPPVIGPAWSDLYWASDNTKRYDCSQNIISAENYMEYNYHQNMNFFFPEQKDKMRYMLSVYRSYIFTNNQNNPSVLSIQCSPPAGGSNTLPFTPCPQAQASYPDQWLRMNGDEINQNIDLCTGTNPVFNLVTTNQCMNFPSHKTIVGCTQEKSFDGACHPFSFCKPICEAVQSCQCYEYRRILFLSIWTQCDGSFNCNNEIQKYFTYGPNDQLLTNIDVAGMLGVDFGNMPNGNNQNRYIIKMATFDANGNWRSGQKYLTYIPQNRTFPDQFPNGFAIQNQKAVNNIIFSASCKIPTNSEYIAGNQISISDEASTNGLIESHLSCQVINCNSASQRLNNIVPEKLLSENVGEENSNLLDINKYFNSKGVDLQTKQDEKIAIKPNPNNGNFILTFNQREWKLNSIEIQNSLGIVIQTISQPSVSTEINIHDQPSGLYLVKLNYADKVITKKVIKQ